MVFPDYQGIGIGREFTNYVADLLLKENKIFISTTSNPAMISARKKDKKWITTRIGRTSSGSGRIQNKYKRGSTSCARITVSFEYIGNNN